MIYILTIVLFVLGVGYHIMQTVDKLKNKHKEFSFKQIFSVYFNEEWNVLIRSGLVLATYELFLFIISMAEVVMPEWWEKYLVVYGLAVVLGYAGQRLIYKYLGTAEKTLNDLNKN